MPNHVKNILTMKGISKLPLFAESEKGKRFDFDKIIPMPPSLNLESGTMEDIAIEAVLRAVAETQYGFERKKARPVMCDDEYKRRLESCGKTEEELLEMGLQYITNKVRYGATTWYDWCNAHWGTKWNAYENDIIDSDTITFQTAWSCPIPVIIQLSKMYPDLQVEIWWADEDMGSNTGHAVLVSGELTEGGDFENGSSTAYAAYIHCWGESDCLCQDDNGNWQHRDCELCHGCD